jgi:hypothetical protein
MVPEKKPVVLTGESSFEDLLDTTCERLKDTHAQYSIRRIRELDEELRRIEKELDEFLSGR